MSADSGTAAPRLSFLAFIATKASDRAQIIALHATCPNLLAIDIYIARKRTVNSFITSTRRVPDGNLLNYSPACLLACLAQDTCFFFKQQWMCDIFDRA